ncbi:MAG: tetratricopeptide repeat protein [Anaerolineaceae bacterium]|nr:tetratricopeptide repeat protein [Anaerolineaceae bacterium]
MDKPKSLQEIIQAHKQRLGLFYGRKVECENFLENLMLPMEDQGRKFLFNIYGQGGVGKTWLLLEIEKIAREHEILSIKIDREISTVLDGMDQIAKNLEEQGYDFKNFRNRYKSYIQKCNDLQTDPQVPEGIASLLSTVIVNAGYSLVQGTPAIVVTKIVNKKMAEEQLGKVLSFITRKITSKEDQFLILHPLEAITPEFLSDLRESVSSDTFLLCIDSFERNVDVLDLWLLELLRGTYGALPPGIMLIIAGRDPLDSNRWDDYQSLITRLPLEPFTAEECAEYLNLRGIKNQKNVQIIISLSEGLPMLVNMLASQSPKSIEGLGDISGKAIERFLQWVEDPFQREIAINAALPRFLDYDILEQLTDPGKSDVLFSWLQKMPFIQSRGEHQWVYHDMVRDFMLRYKRQISPQSWKEIHIQLADYYDKRRVEMNLPNEMAIESKGYQQCILEICYHRFCSNPPLELATALNLLVQYLLVGGDLDLRIAQALHQAELDCDVQIEYRWGDSIIDGLRAYSEKEDLNKTLTLLQRIIKFPKLSPDLVPKAHITCGIIYDNLQQYSEAILSKSRALELAPENAEYFFSRGKSYEDFGQHIKAIDDFNKAIELNSMVGMYYIHRGSALKEVNRLEESISDFRRALELSRGELCERCPACYRNLAISYLDLNRYEESIAALTRLIEVDPTTAENFGLRGWCWYHLKNYEEALKDCNKALELQPICKTCTPNCPICYILHSYINKAFNNYDGAIADETKIIELLPENAEHYFNRGLNYSHIGQHEEAIADITHAIELEPLNPLYYIGRGLSYLETRRYKESIADFTHVIELEPGNALCYFYRGLSYDKTGEHQEAIADKTRAIELDPKNAEYYHSRGVSYFYSKRLDDAIDNMSQAIIFDPNNAFYYKERGFNYNLAGRYAEAIVDLTQAIDIEPGNAQYYHLRGSSYFAAGRYDEAIADVTRAIELEPNNAELYRNRGAIYRANGQYENAVTDGTHAIELEQGNGLCYLSRGLSYQATGRFSEAITDITQAIELEPSHYDWYEDRAKAYEANGEPEKATMDRALAAELKTGHAE